MWQPPKFPPCLQIKHSVFYQPLYRPGKSHGDHPPDLDLVQEDDRLVKGQMVIEFHEILERMHQEKPVSINYRKAERKYAASVQLKSQPNPPDRFWLHFSALLYVWPNPCALSPARISQEWIAAMIAEGL